MPFAGHTNARLESVRSEHLKTNPLSLELLAASSDRDRIFKNTIVGPERELLQGRAASEKLVWALVRVDPGSRIRTSRTLPTRVC